MPGKGSPEGRKGSSPDGSTTLDEVRCAGIYLTLNPVNPALLGRVCNRLAAAEQTTADRDITRLRWLLIDIDPKRPAGISSTDAEHRAAIDHANWLRGALAGQGWPSPLVGDSGNGAHLLYRLADLENTEAGVSRVKNTLRALNALYSVTKFPEDGGSVSLDIDVTVFNPARISKLYGTTARKGDDTNERPHRQARVLTWPDESEGQPCVV